VVLPDTVPPDVIAGLRGVGLIVLAEPAPGPDCAGLLAAVTVVVGGLARRRLGSVTGDVMGAAIELTATLGLILAAAWSA
jgi:cobalamin synthase